MLKADNTLSRREFLKTIGISAAIVQFPHLAYGAEGVKLAKDQVLRHQLGDAKDLRPCEPAWGQGESIVILQDVFNALVEFEPGRVDRIIPCLAERWELSKDKMTWTFHLRKGVQFHQNFGEVTAEDVKFSYDRLKKINAVWQKPTFKEVEVVDKYTVRIHPTSPDAYFLYKVCNMEGGEIVSRKAVESIGNEAFKLKPIGGTGPFVFADYIPAKSVTFVRNSNYFKGKPILDKVEHIFIPDVNSRLLALKNGNLDVITGTGEFDWTNARKNEGYKIVGGWGNAYWLHLNMSQKPFDILKVRQAIAYAIDREQIAEFYGGLMRPLYGYVSPTCEGYLEKSEIPERYHYSYDPDRARKLLAEAGFPKGFEFRVVSHSRTIYVKFFMMIQAQLRLVGIDMKITATDVALYYDAIFKDKNPIVLWGQPYFTPDSNLSSYWASSSIVTKPTGLKNWSHYGDIGGSIDELLDEARQTFDVEKRKGLYQKAQMRLYEGLPSIPLAYKASGNDVFQPYVDLGYEFINSVNIYPQLTEKTRILEH